MPPFVAPTIRGEVQIAFLVRAHSCKFVDTRLDSFRPCIASVIQCTADMFGDGIGRAFTVESSANLRSCSSIEQLCMTHDRALFDFHRGWITNIMEAKK